MSRLQFRSCSIFKAYLKNSLVYLKFNFSHFTPQIQLFCGNKGNLKFSDSKIRWKED